MDFLVVGPGAMGTLFAVNLKRAGHSVTMLDHDAERARRISENALRVEGTDGSIDEHISVSTEPPASQPDLVLICVKAHQTHAAAERLKGWLGDRTVLLTLQNGIGNAKILVEAFGHDRVYWGVTAEGATLLAPGHIRHAGSGETVIGPEGRSGDLLPSVVSAFNEAGFKTRAAKDVDALIWGKLIINVGINALTAVTRLKNGRLPDIEGTRDLMAALVEEAVAVAKAKGVELPYPDPMERVLEVCRATGDNIASMLQDVLKERMTEVAFINGAIVREGQALGIPTPVNRTLTRLVEALQVSYSDRIN